MPAQWSLKGEISRLEYVTNRGLEQCRIGDGRVEISTGRTSGETKGKRSKHSIIGVFSSPVPSHFSISSSLHILTSTAHRPGHATHSLNPSAVRPFSAHRAPDLAHAHGTRRTIDDPHMTDVSCSSSLLHQTKAEALLVHLATWYVLFESVLHPNQVFSPRSKWIRGGILVDSWSCSGGRMLACGQVVAFCRLSSHPGAGEVLSGTSSAQPFRVPACHAMRLILIEYECLLGCLLGASCVRRPERAGR